MSTHFLSSRSESRSQNPKHQEALKLQFWYLYRSGELIVAVFIWNVIAVILFAEVSEVFVISTAHIPSIAIAVTGLLQVRSLTTRDREKFKKEQKAERLLEPQLGKVRVNE